MPQVRAPSDDVRGFHFSGFGARTWAGKFRKPSDNLELLGNPSLARLRLRGTLRLRSRQALGHQARLATRTISTYRKSGRLFILRVNRLLTTAIIGNR